MGKVHSKDFHTMRGHVEDGKIIIAPSGREYTLKSTMRGWRVVGPDGLEVSGNLNSAHDVEYFVVNGLQNS